MSGVQYYILGVNNKGILLSLAPWYETPESMVSILYVVRNKNTRWSVQT